MPTSISTGIPVTPAPIPYAGGASVGVAMVAPPEELLPSITSAIEAACKSIPDGRTAALVALVDTKGANLAYVRRIGTHVKVMAWAGKSWGTPVEAGASVMASW